MATLEVHAKLTMDNGDVIELPFKATFANEEEAVDQYWAVVRGSFGESEKAERGNREARKGQTKGKK